MTAQSSLAKTEVQVRALDERRKLGAYYTPERLSQILANWAIRSSSDTVLEPSFGGCGFLAAARNALSARGCARPTDQIFGCDIDPVAFTYLATVFGGPTDTRGFVLKDYLDCESVEVWPEAFTTVLANPPYIPHHRIGKDRVKALSARTSGIPGVGGRSGLWAYFISQAVAHLQVRGRMAWVLPGAFLQADYAEPIRDYLGRRFDRCAAFLIRDRLFLNEGTDEETVILLADGHRPEASAGTIEVGEARTLDELESLISLWSSGEWKGVTRGFSPAALSMSDIAWRLFAKLAKAPEVVALKSVARVQIGLVTGDNSFFVLGTDGLNEFGLAAQDCLPVLSKFRAAPGIDLKPSDLIAYAETGGRTSLVTATEVVPGTPVGDYLSTFDKERRQTISTFKKRPSWCAVSDGNTPDAFLPVMHHNGPRLVLNPAGYNCTNTIHRVFFEGSPTVTRRKLVAISLLTTFSQISAELHGRRYGSGVLKHEPRDAERIQILLPQEASQQSISKAYAQIDACLRNGDDAGARMKADAAVMGWAALGWSDSDHKVLADALTEMRARRRPNRSRSNPAIVPHSTQSGRVADVQAV